MITDLFSEYLSQKYMDFVPGYRLIHIEELKGEYDTFLGVLDLDDLL